MTSEETIELLELSGVTLAKTLVDELGASEAETLFDTISGSLDDDDTSRLLDAAIDNGYNPQQRGEYFGLLSRVCKDSREYVQ